MSYNFDTFSADAVFGMALLKLSDTDIVFIFDGNLPYNSIRKGEHIYTKDYYRSI
jgi:hypothetical protein